MTHGFPLALVYPLADRLVGFNDDFEAFVYAVLTSFSLLLLMEAITLSVVEGLKDPMLSVTFSMIVRGSLLRLDAREACLWGWSLAHGGGSYLVSVIGDGHVVPMLNLLY